MDYIHRPQSCKVAVGQSLEDDSNRENPDSHPGPLSLFLPRAISLSTTLFQQAFTSVLIQRIKLGYSQAGAGRGAHVETVRGCQSGRDRFSGGSGREREQQSARSKGVLYGTHMYTCR